MALQLLQKQHERGEGENEGRCSRAQGVGGQCRMALPKGGGGVR